MHQLLKPAFYSLCLRGLSMVCKFLLVVYLAKYTSPTVLGEYGLFTATIGFAIYLLGFEFHTFTSRELPGKDNFEWAKRIRDQLKLLLFVYLIAFPLLSIVFLSELINSEYWVWFYVLLTLEHLSLELYRLLVTRGHPVAATFSFFLRSGLWPILLIGTMTWATRTRTIQTVFVCWALGCASAILFSATTFRDLPWKKIRSISVDYAWLQRGIVVSGSLLLSTLSFKALLTFDRYILKIFQGEELVGAYTLFVSMAVMIYTVIETGIVIGSSPKIIAAQAKSENSVFKKEMRDLTVGILGLTCFSSLSLVLLAKPLLNFLGKGIYLRQINAFYILIAGFAVFSVGMIPQIELYVKRRDLHLILGSVVGSVTGAILQFVLVPKYSIQGCAAATSIALVATSLYQAVVVYLKK